MSADYARIQLNGLQVGQPGTAPLRYGKRHHNRGRNQCDQGQPKTAPDNPCPTCGLQLQPEPPCTTTRDGRTYTTQISRCNNKRQKCSPQITETEITMPRHPNPSRPRSNEWIESVHTRRADLGLSLNKLAKASGVHLSMLGKALNPNYGATDDTVFAIEQALDAAEVAAQHAEHDAPEGVPVVKPEPVKERELSTPQPVAELGEKVSTLSDQQNTFWNELAVAMRRITALEADRREPGLLAEAELAERIDTLRSEFAAFRDASKINFPVILDAQGRITTAETEIASNYSEFAAFRDAANEQIDKLFKFDYANDRIFEQLRTRITITEAEINNLAKSVNIIDAAQDGLLQSVDAHREAIADIHDQIAGLTKTVDARCCPRDDHREAIDYHRNQLLRHHARITDLEIAAEQPGKDNDLGFLELARVVGLALSESDRVRAILGRIQEAIRHLPDHTLRDQLQREIDEALYG